MKSRRFLSLLFCACLCISAIGSRTLYASANHSPTDFVNGKVKVTFGTYNYDDISYNRGYSKNSYGSFSPFNGGTGTYISDSSSSMPIKSFIGGVISFTHTDLSVMFSAGSTLDVSIPNMRYWIEVDRNSSHPEGSVSGLYSRYFNKAYWDTGFMRTYMYLYDNSNNRSFCDISNFTTISYPSSGLNNIEFNFNIDDFVLPCNVYKIEILIVALSSDFCPSYKQYVGNSNYTVYNQFQCGPSSIKFTETSSSSSGSGATSEDIESINNNLTGLAGRIATAVSGFFSTLGDYINNGFSNLISNFTSLISTLKTNLVNTFNSVGSSITSALSTVKDNIVTMKDNLVSNIVSLKDNVVSNIVSLKDSLIARLDSIRDSIIAGITGLFVPDSAYLDNIYSRFNSILAARFGGLYEVGNYIFEFFGKLTVVSGSGVVTIPEVTVPLGSYSFSFGGYDVALVPQGTESFAETVKYVVDVVCTTSFFCMLYYKYRHIFSR